MWHCFTFFRTQSIQNTLFFSVIERIKNFFTDVDSIKRGHGNKHMHVILRV
ncbi:MAG: hypothetical protein HC767_01085 [Akkermansiaceae bacterium]|nr:hypothetical protein [Akkermansiaceae bacterium]